MIDSWNPAELNQGVHKNLDAIVDNLVQATNSGTGKNLNFYPYYQTTHTNSGVSFTDNGDGTITATGKSTASVKSLFMCHSRTANSKNYLFLPNGKYILSGCPSGGDLDKYSLEVGATIGGVYFSYGFDTGSGFVFNVNGDDNNTDGALINLVCNCYHNYEVPDGGLIFKPMITRYSNNGEWKPYIPSTYDQAALLDQLKCKQGTAGNYYLTATVDSDGVVTYSWEEIT